LIIHKNIKASKNIKLFILALLFSGIFSCIGIAQTIIINTVDYKLNAEDTVGVARMIKFEAEIYNGIFDEPIPDSLPVIINLFKSRNSFKRGLGINSDLVSPDGYYNSQSRQCYVYKSSDYLNVIFHEVSHRFMHYHNYMNVPRWINEGLSEFFEGLYLKEKKYIYVDQQSGRLKRVREYLKSKQLNLQQFLNRQTDVIWNKKEEVTFHYDVAYSIVYYIVKNRPHRIKEILTALKKSKSSFNAIACAYGSYETFENGFREFYQ
jgi:hypothetical protein